MKIQNWQIIATPWNATRPVKSCPSETIWKLLIQDPDRYRTLFQFFFSSKGWIYPEHIFSEEVYPEIFEPDSKKYFGIFSNNFEQYLHRD